MTPTYNDVEIMIVGESWGTEERRMQLPFMGKSGQILEILMRETYLDINRCIFTNVVSDRPPGNEMARFFHITKQARADSTPLLRGLYPKEVIYNGLARLYEQIEAINPRLIIGLGNYTLWALTEDCFTLRHDDITRRLVPAGIGDYRGSQLRTTTTTTEGISFLPTYRPAATFRVYPWRAMIRHDLKVRVPKAFETSGWEKPDRYYIVRPSYAEVDRWLRELLSLANLAKEFIQLAVCLLYTSPSPRDRTRSRMPSSA